MTRASYGRATIEDKLDGQVDFIRSSIASNLDAISKTAQCTVCPARSAILRNVLIERMCQVGNAIDVAPCKVRGEVFCVNVSVRERRRVRFGTSVAGENLQQGKKC